MLLPDISNLIFSLLSGQYPVIMITSTSQEKSIANTIVDRLDFYIIIKNNLFEISDILWHIE